MKINSSFLLKKRENGYYYIGYHVNGKLHWKTTGCTLKHEALAFFKSYSAEVDVPEKSIILSQLMVQLEASKTLRNNTLQSYNTAVTVLIRHAGDRPVNEYQLADLEAFKQHQLERKVSDTSINIWIRALVAVFSYAVKRQYLSKNPFSLSLTIKIAKKPPLFITQEEFGKLLGIVKNETLRDFYTVAGNTGMRLSELLNLQWSHVSLEKKQIGVVNTEEFTTKSGRSRIVPMNQLVYDILSRRFTNRNGSLYVFHKSNGYKYEKNFISHRFKKYVVEAGLNNKYHFHTLRHSFASWLALNEVPIFSIQQLLGHSSVNTTLQYAHLSSSVLHSAVNKI